MSTVRLRRLQSDYENLREFVRLQPRVRLIQANGIPPESYQLEYQVSGLRQVDDQLQVVKSHMVEILLPRAYPRTPPQCRMLTPVFHPNIAPHAICIGDHWSPGEPLWSMVARIGEMIAYQSYNTKSPLNGEAARWVDQHQDHLPLDRVNLSVDVPAVAVGSAPPVVAPPAIPVASAVAPPLSSVPPPLPTAAASASAAPASLNVPCPGCGAVYRVPATAVGKRLRCKRCQGIIDIRPAPFAP